MDGDLNEVLRSVLSDPEKMGQIASMAQSLMGNGEAPPQIEAPPPPRPEPSSEKPLIDNSRLLSALTGALGQKGSQTRSAALLTAMRPYMKQEKQEKLDRAMQIARMVRVAGTVMRQLGGGNGI